MKSWLRSQMLSKRIDNEIQKIVDSKSKQQELLLEQLMVHLKEQKMVDVDEVRKKIADKNADILTEDAVNIVASVSFYTL